MRPLLDLGWGNRLHKVSRSIGNIWPYCLHNQATIPSGVKLALAFSGHGYVVSAPVILE